jgi:hypothetical protein
LLIQPRPQTSHAAPGFFNDGPFNLKNHPNLQAQIIIMKKMILALACLITGIAQAQTADEIVASNAKAVGGLEQFKALKTVKMTGSVSMQGNDFSMTLQIINGRASRTDLDVMGQAVVNCYKDGKGWKINPFAGAEAATDVTGDELDELKLAANIANPLVDYKSRGSSIELKGTVDVEGVKCFEILLTPKDGKHPVHYFIDTKDYTVIKSTSTRSMQGNDMEVETFYSNYKDVNGLRFAFTRTMKVSGEVFQEVTFEAIELNVAIDEKIFDKQ